MLKECNILCAHDENSSGGLRALASLKASFADRFRRLSGKPLRETPMHSDLAVEDELEMRREILQISLRRARAIIQRRKFERGRRRSNAHGPLAETNHTSPATPEPEIPADWKLGLRMARSYTSELRKVLFNSCCQLQRDSSSVNLHELWRVVALLRVAEKREQEFTHVAGWANSLVAANDEDIG